MSASQPRYGVVLMTYGSPSSVSDVRRYMTAVRGGRDPGDELVAEFERRYEVIGGSPLIAITESQAHALEERLGGDALVRAAMRFSSPTIRDALTELRDEGVDGVVGVIMSPQFSPLLMGGYQRAVDEARTEMGPSAPTVVIAGGWYREPSFV